MLPLYTVIICMFREEVCFSGQRFVRFLFHLKKCLKLQIIILSKLTFQIILDLMLSLNSLVLLDWGAYKLEQGSLLIRGFVYYKKKP